MGVVSGTGDMGAVAMWRLILFAGLWILGCVLLCYIIQQENKILREFERRFHDGEK